MARVQRAEELALYERTRANVVDYLARELTATVDAEVIGRITPLQFGSEGTMMRPWPSGSGRLSVLREKNSIILVTDGLSDPWDPDLFGENGWKPLGYELTLHVDPREDDPPGTLAGSWPAQLMFALASFLTSERIELRSGLERFRCLTLACPPVAGLEDHVDSNGYIGMLVGMPIMGVDIDAHLYANVGDIDNIGYFPVKLLQPSEYGRARALGDTGAVSFATRFLNQVFPLRSSPNRLPVF